MKLQLISRWLGGAIIVTGLLVGGASTVTASQFISIGTGAVTGVYYPAGGAICRMVNESRSQHGLRCAVESTGGSIDNINTIRTGELEFGIAQSDAQYHAYNGSSIFEKQEAFKKLRSVFSLHTEPVTIVARRDAGIKQVRDLKGKRVNIGNPGSGMRATWEILEAALGWKRSDLQEAVALRLEEAGQGLCRNEIDAAFSLVGHPSGLMKETALSCEVTFVPVTGAEVDELVADKTFFRQATIPGALYQGVAEDIQTFGLSATLVTTSDVPDDVVYAVAKTVLNSIEEFRTLHPTLKYMIPAEMVAEGLTAPLHPGAVRAYKELNLIR